MRIALLLVLAPALAAAQSVPRWADSTPEPREPVLEEELLWALSPTSPSTPTVVPIDGGLGLLALAGGAYAAARLRRRRDE